MLICVLQMQNILYTLATLFFTTKNVNLIVQICPEDLHYKHFLAFTACICQ